MFCLYTDNGIICVDSVVSGKDALLMVRQNQRLEKATVSSIKRHFCQIVLHEGLQRIVINSAK